MSAARFRGGFAQLLAWLHQLGEATILRHPDLAAYKAWRLHMRGHMVEAERCTDLDGPVDAEPPPRRSSDLPGVSGAEPGQDHERAGELPHPLASDMLDSGIVPPGAEGVINYGLDKIRFIAPVPTEACVTVRFTLAGAEDKAPKNQVPRIAAVLNIGGSQKPAVAGDIFDHIRPPAAASGHVAFSSRTGYPDSGSGPQQGRTSPSESQSDESHRNRTTCPAELPRRRRAGPVRLYAQARCRMLP